MFPPMLNVHENGILRYTISPAPMTAFMKSHRVFERAQETMKTFLESINSQCPEGYVGLMAMELFITQDGRILFNEIAPRPHNSGHGTLDSHYISQNHLWMSAVDGKTLDQTPEFRQHVIMENVLSQAELASVMDGKSR
jgi:5-(carboxyamino)imidazole ribonucleotide synthase